MDTSERVAQAIFDAIGCVNELLPEDQSLEGSGSTVLSGESGALDSLGLINLVASIEEEVERALGKQISLVDGLEITEEDSPFRTVATLTEYVAKLVRDA